MSVIQIDLSFIELAKSPIAEIAIVLLTVSIVFLVSTIVIMPHFTVALSSNKLMLFIL